MKRVMVDLETLDTLPTAMILSIGAVWFDVDGDEAGDLTFYSKIDPRADMGTIGVDTVMWWMRQSDEARASVSAEGGDMLEVALLKFSDFCRGLDELWAGPAHFDVPILETAFRSLLLPVPWTHRQVRCWSTFRKLVPVDKPPNRCEHHALADAQSQVAAFRQSWRKLQHGSAS